MHGSFLGPVRTWVQWSISLFGEKGAAKKWEGPIELNAPKKSFRGRTSARFLRPNKNIILLLICCFFKAQW